MEHNFWGNNILISIWPILLYNQGREYSSFLNLIYQGKDCVHFSYLLFSSLTDNLVAEVLISHRAPAPVECEYNETVLKARGSNSRPQFLCWNSSRLVSGLSRQDGRIGWAPVAATLTLLFYFTGQNSCPSGVATFHLLNGGLASAELFKPTRRFQTTTISAFIRMQRRKTAALCCEENTRELAVPSFTTRVSCFSIKGGNYQSPASGVQPNCQLNDDEVATSPSRPREMAILFRVSLADDCLPYPGAEVK